MTQELFNLAQQRHQSGQFAEAQALYRQLMTEQPNHAAAVHFLGLTEFQLNRFDSALDLIDRSIRLDPNRSDFYCNLGLVLATTGKMDQAIAAYQRALELRPDYAEAHSNLGIAFAAQGDYDRAAAEYRAAIRIRPQYPEAFNNLGSALHSLSRYPDAIEAFTEALKLNPNLTEARNNLGNVLLDNGQIDEALEAFTRALAGPQKLPQSFYGLGNVLRKKDRMEDAIESFRRAIVMNPEYGEAFNNLGETLLTASDIPLALSALARAAELRPKTPTVLYNFANALMHDGQYEQAKAIFHRALQIKPDYPEAQTNLANAYLAQGHIEQALAEYQLTLKKHPDFALAHWNNALALLLTGDWPRGWPEYEWRWKNDSFKLTRPAKPELEWDGADPAGKRILLYTEQGFGDAIQFFRYTLFLSQRCNVIVQAPPQLIRLFRQTPGIEIVATDQALPPFDVHFPLLSLPRIYKTTIETIPANVPYLRASPDMIQQWRTRLPSDPKLLKVGLVWRGRLIPDAHRSIPSDSLEPLANVPGVWFTNLQVGHPATPTPFPVTDFRDDLNDFADSAALMANLDLILTIDTAAAHLAGALGRPTWTLLKYVPDWRWLRERDDSPFYPTMRLFRQTSLGDWTGVIARVAEELKIFASNLPANRAAGE